MTHGAFDASGGDGTDVFVFCYASGTKTGGAGDDVIIAEHAFVTAVYTGDRNDFRVETYDDGIRVTDLAGDQGTDLLVGVAQLQFEDGLIALA